MKVGSNEEGLIKALGKDLMPNIKSQAQAAVREIIAEGNRRGVEPSQMPYLFWALATQRELPDLGGRQRYFQVMIDMMTRTGVLPNYQKNFRVPDDLGLDDAVDAVAQHMATWAVRSMLPALLAGYMRVLSVYASKVPAATDGVVPASNGVGYLNALLREILTLRSAWFDDGELLRRVVRLLPEW